MDLATQAHDISPTTAVNFKPHRLIAGGHVQTILPRIGPANWRHAQNMRYLARQAEEHIIKCQDDVRLHGLHNKQADPTAPLIIFLHGWEGCADSKYLCSAASYMHRRGFAVFRLNMRDHGPSHHLNRDVFNSARLDEVIDAISYVSTRFNASSLALCGFSLGGNFVIRIATSADSQVLRLAQACAINPVINPKRTAEHILTTALYHYYFLRKWKRSLLLKNNLFDALIDKQKVLSSKDYQQLCEYFVAELTPFESVDDYYRRYTIAQEMLDNCKTPLALYLSKNDPVVPFATSSQLTSSERVSVYVTDSGGHCGYQENIFGKSWIDQRIYSHCAHLLERSEQEEALLPVNLRLAFSNDYF